MPLFSITQCIQAYASQLCEPHVLPARRRTPRRESLFRTVEAMEPRCLLTSYVWIGLPEETPAENQDFSGNFSDPAHWVTEGTLGFFHEFHVHGVPGPGDVAIVSHGDTITIDGPVTVGSVSAGGDARFHIKSGATFTVTSGATNSLAHVNLDNGATLQVTGDDTSLVIGSAFEGESTYAGTLTADAGAKLIFGGTFDTHELNAGTQFSGSGLFSRTGFNLPQLNVNTPLTFPENFELGNGALTLNADVTIGLNFRQFNNGAGGNVIGTGSIIVPEGSTYVWEGAEILGGGKAFNVESGGTLEISGTGPNRNLFDRTINNAGTILWKDEGDVGGADATINNLATGTFNIVNDRRILSGDAITINNLGVMNKSSDQTSGSARTDLSAYFTNSGTVNVYSGAIQFGRGTNEGTISTAANTQVIYAGTLGNDEYFYHPGTMFDGPGTLVVWGEAVLHIDTNLTLSNLRQQSSIGKITSTGDLTMTNTYDWHSGRYDGTGLLNIASGAVLNFSLTEGSVAEVTINNAGTANWSVANTIVDFAGTGRFNNLAGGVFNVAADAGINLPVNNEGTINKTSSGIVGTTNFFSSLTNLGIINVISGQLHTNFAYHQDAGTTAISSGATLSTGTSVNIAGGTLEGSGTVVANVTNAGCVRPGTSTGKLTITGNYTQTADGVLDVQLGGTTPGTQLDQLAVSGIASLDGTVNVSLVNGFVPASQSQFAVLTFGSINGDLEIEKDVAAPTDLYFLWLMDADSFDLIALINAASPVFTSSATPSIAENTTSVLTVTATDSDLPTQSITYAISGGADQSLFTLNGVALSFVSAPNFEVPADSDANNHYEVEVTANDGFGRLTVQTIDITVTNVADGPQLNLGGPAVTWIKKQPPVTIVPQLTVVSGTDELGGGTLTLSVNAVATKRKLLDQFAPLSFSSIGTSSGPVFGGGTLTLQIQLNANVTDAAIQTFLSGIHFSTQGGGLKAAIRTFSITLADAGGQSNLVTQIINVKKKA